ncbi:MAG: hypothetical protein N2645_04575 [Clostridia bacterium]|nr:hypothetical protein [Clostridia bacterium]
MDFYIQASCPRYTGVYDEEDYNLSTAIETIFPMMAEKAIMAWKSIYIPLCYKYDISYMLEDILNILENLRDKVIGELSLHWASDTFANVWKIKWDSKDVEINSEWGSVLGHTEELLKLKGPVVISKKLFANEWKRVLHNVIEGLKLSGYSADKLPGMDRLISEYNTIEKEGILYDSKETDCII